MTLGTSLSPWVAVNQTKSCMSGTSMLTLIFCFPELSQVGGLCPFSHFEWHSVGPSWTFIWIVLGFMNINEIWWIIEALFHHFSWTLMKIHELFQLGYFTFLSLSLLSLSAFCLSAISFAAFSFARRSLSLNSGNHESRHLPYRSLPLQ